MLAGTAAADESQPDGWTFSLTPYLWAAGLYGDVTVRGNTASISSSFIDTLQTSDSVLGFQGHFEARRGRLGGFIDGTYMKLGEDDIAVGPLSVDATQELTFVEFGLLYRVADLPWESGGGDPTFNSPLGAHIDVYGGGRYTHIGAELEFPIGASVDGSRDWVDPIVGMRVTGDLSEHWQIILGGDVGGFGVNSNFAWSAVGLLSYRFEMLDLHSSAVAGYRALGQDYDAGSGANRFQWDVTMHGPIIGLMLRF